MHGARNDAKNKRCVFMVNAELKGVLKRSVSASQWRPKAGTVLNDVLGAENKGDELDAQMLRNEAQRCC